ncbi:FMN-binding protein [Streptacidiphilus sp. N1-12]|uniref:FMN-binding protein n=2 Tax=Streptacidiphilus alkalitolerans TaxID=3342712 RepID=A0ABV6XCC4_9ACTN
MRRIAVTAAGTALGVVLLLAAKPHHTVAVPGASSGGSSGTSSGGAAGSGSASGVHTVTGGTVQTQWGPVQLKVTFDGTRITAVDVLQQPNGTPRDEEINAQALPILTQETLAAQSAKIDAVSGATYTSQGYIGSLQSALDAAK